MTNLTIANRAPHNWQPLATWQSLGAHEPGSRLALTNLAVAGRSRAWQSLGAHG